jgi:hypothetical protein
MKEIRTVADVDLGRLYELADMLGGDEPMAPDDRREVAALLFALHRLAAPIEFPNLTRRPPTAQRDRARAVRTLVEAFDVTNKAAARTLLPDATDTEIDALLRAARREKWSRLPDDHPMVVEALATLRREGKL